MSDAMSDSATYGDENRAKSATQQRPEVEVYLPPIPNIPDPRSGDDRRAPSVEGKKDDGVNSPSHYGGKDNPHETVKCLRAWGLYGNALRFNAAKYLSRAGRKTGEALVKDLEKAIWYIQAEIREAKGLAP